jgi:hypothetical protein
MSQFQTVAMRLVVLVALYAMAAQAMLMRICPPTQADGQTVTCDRTGSKNNIPLPDAECCPLSCCTVASATWMPAVPIMVHAPLRVTERVVWAGVEGSSTHSRIVAHAYATGPPILPTPIAI